MNKIYELLTKEELKRCQIIHPKKDEILFTEGERCINVGILERGEIRITSFLEDGSEIVYNVISPGMIFGNNLLFSSDPIYRGDVIAASNSKVILIKQNILLDILQENREFMIAYLNQQSNFGKELNLKLKLLTFKNAIDRVNYYLSVNYNRVYYKTISDLAKNLGLTREVLSRTLHKMQKDGLILIRDKKIIKL